MRATALRAFARHLTLDPSGPPIRPIPASITTVFLPVVSGDKKSMTAKAMPFLHGFHLL